MRVWINQRNDELLFVNNRMCYTTPLDALSLRYNYYRAKTERANFVEQWHKRNPSAEVTFDGQAWPLTRDQAVRMRDFDETYSFWIHSPLSVCPIPTYNIETLQGEILILQIYSRKDKLGRLRAHVRIRERDCEGTPSFLLLDH